MGRQWEPVVDFRFPDTCYRGMYLNEPSLRYCMYKYHLLTTIETLETYCCRTLIHNSPYRAVSFCFFKTSDKHIIIQLNVKQN